jgi:hypothetical protein
MVRGFKSFKEWFEGYEEQYTIIGGTACDLIMAEEEMHNFIDLIILKIKVILL